MSKPQKHMTKSKKKFLYVPLFALPIIGVFAFLIGKDLNQLAKEPETDKDCLPVETDNQSEKSSITETHEYRDSLNWIQKGGTINDASCLNRTSVYGIVDIKTEEDVRDALQFVKERKLKVAMAGVKHSMGGQAFFNQALVLDMRNFNKKELHEERKTITVQSGATWHDIQNMIHPKYAIKAMQSTDIFTVGGSISVNAHGMDHQAGSVAESIVSMRVMLADGSIQTVSKTLNPELFRSIVGGYGLFGVILDAELQIVDNDIYDYQNSIISYTEFPQLFEKIETDSNYGLMYAHLSTAPHNFLKEMLVYTYYKKSGFEGDIPALSEATHIKLKRLVLNLSKRGRLTKEFKWFSEKNIDPLLTSCLTNRNQAMSEGEACFVSRNEPMHDSVKYLRNALPNETDILQEYYVPRAELLPFVDGLREVLMKDNANIMNASVRVIHKEDIVLNYAPEDMFAVVLYVNQSTDKKGNEQMKKLTQDLIDLTLQHRGTFFLPYQLHYTAEQLHKSYPQAKTFFELKRKYDKDELFTNTFYEKYGKG